ncbi:MAG: hypothetical protein HYU66_09820 [Armatimonadetes bacterium]|nr:hypothetical protein [Armatimonadota bacterium]
MGKRKAPWWLRILKALGWLVLIGLLVVFGPGLLPHRADVETIPDPRRDVPDAQNALLGIQRALEPLLGPPAPPGALPTMSIAAERAAEAAIRSDPTRLDAADRAAALPDARWPQADPLSADPAALAAAMRLRSYVRLRGHRAQRRFDAGDAAGGIADGFGIAGLGRRLTDGGGTFTSYAMATAFEAIGLQALRAGLGRSPGLDPARHDPTVSWPRGGWSEAQKTAWRDALRRLDGWLNEPQACQHMLAVEYHWTKADLEPPTGTRSKSGFTNRATFFCMPRETVRLARRGTEEAIRQAALPAWQRDLGRIRIPPAHGVDKVYNFVGRALLDMTDSVRPTMLQLADRRRWELASIQTCIALRIYLEDHGRLPGSLSELAPAYLREPPIDPFDGKLVRYVPVRGMIYCVGPNGKDEGGARGGRPVAAGKGPDDLRTMLPFLAAPAP